MFKSNFHSSIKIGFSTNKITAKNEGETTVKEYGGGGNHDIVVPPDGHYSEVRIELQIPSWIDKKR